MTKILTAPTWQIFILLFLCLASFNLGIIIVLIFSAFLTYCIYFLGKSLYSKLPSGHDLKIRRFYFHVFSILPCFAVLFSFADGISLINPKTNVLYDWAVYVVVPIQFLLMFSFLYAIWFIAKSIATIQKQRVVVFREYQNDFYLLWLPLVGVWWVHPKVRKIFSVD
jgi:hypothetical protein